MDNFRRRLNGKSIVATKMFVTNMTVVSNSTSQASGSILKSQNPDGGHFCRIDISYTLGIDYEIVNIWNNGDMTVIKNGYIEYPSYPVNYPVIYFWKKYNSVYFNNGLYSDSFYLKDNEYKIGTDIYYNVSGTNELYFNDKSSIGSIVNGDIICSGQKRDGSYIRVTIAEGTITKISNDRIDYQMHPV